MKIKYNKRELKIAGITLLSGLILGWLFFGGSGNTQNAANQKIETHNPSGDEVSIWTCSMHPQIKMDKPGQCPICGMDLIPLDQSGDNEEAIAFDQIQMSESAIKLADIQTAFVKKGKAEKTINLLGKVQADERRISELTARFGGRIEKLFVNFTGQNVVRGQKLATIYSPELIAAQRELLEASKFKDSNPAFFKSAQTKLKLWDLNDTQINDIIEKGEPQLYFNVLSPITGTVTERHVTIGDYIKEGQGLLEVIDLSKVWVMFDAYESDLPWIKIGDEIDYTIQSVPGKTFSGKITYVDPFINAKTRVAKIRVEQSNPKLELKPEMFVNGILESKMEKSNELLIPKSSILWTGKRAVVYVKVPAKKTILFQYRVIDLGPLAGDFYVVNSGLSEGEEIAINGVFKIDAAAQLAGKPSMMNPEGGKTTSAHDHGEMTDTKDSEMALKMDKINKKNIPDKFKVQLYNTVNEYIKMKDAFFASNTQAVDKSAKDMKSSLKKIDMELLEGNEHMAWMDMLTMINFTLDQVLKGKNIDEKRVGFRDLSNNITTSIEKFGIKSDKTLYLEYCPMADDNKGAFWISANKEIQNPYFGEQMPKCGEVKKIYK
ncbi:MAG: efflux RND transporter periplasmic adaptor subunit [Bacteroidales bacterium]|nr:efflux RND transporter periplasmic adaptor subunit [Bacteroidales bacterium]